MKKVYVDTNIIVDILANRVPFSQPVIKLFQLAEQRRVKLYVSSHCYATTHYLL